MRRCHIIKSLLTLLLLIITTVVLGQNNRNVKNDTTTAAVTTAAPAKQQTWNLKDADIRAVIQTVSVLTGKNIIIDPRVKGKVTFISQKPMTVPEIYQAFLSMLQVLGYTAVPSGHLTKIIPLNDAKDYGGSLASQGRPGRGDQVVVRVIPIKHVSATQLVPIIRSMMQPWGVVNAYMPSNSLILVGAADNLSRLRSIISRMDNQNANYTTVVPLKHANAKNLVTILQSLQGGSQAQGRVINVALAADDQSNSILLNGNVSNIARMKFLIRKLDRPTATNNTVVVHLNYLSAKKLAPVLSKVISGESATQAKGKGGSSAGTSGSSVQAEDNDNAVILHGPANELKSLRRVIRELDVRPSQVLIEAIIVKVDETLLDQLGIVWGTVNSSGGTTSVTDPTTGVAISPSSGGGTFSTPNTFAMQVTSGVGFISGGNLSAIIHALRSNSSSDILATPSIVVLNNKEATIADGKNIGIVNRQYSSTVTNANMITPFNTIQRQDVTLSLKVTPQISPNAMIRMKIAQKNDTIDPSSTGDVDNPILDVSQIKTNVLVRSGDILVLGGLINNNHIVGQQKIPILGDIPLLGHLFRYTSHQIERQNLMVFIKPIILNDRLRANQQTRTRYNYMRERQRDLQQGKPISKHSYSVLPPYYYYHRSQNTLLPPPAITIEPPKRKQKCKRKYKCKRHY